MTREKIRRLKFIFSAGSLVWMALMALLVFTNLPENTVLNHNSYAIQNRMESECATVKSGRYDCMENIIIDGSRHTFWALTSRMFAIMAPPLVALWALNSYLAGLPIEAPPPPRMVPVDPHWKERAQTQVTTAPAHHHNESEAARPSHHLSLADIAPLEDWTAKAQRPRGGGVKSAED